LRTANKKTERANYAVSTKVHASVPIYNVFNNFNVLNNNE
jgi:hypothetical protein